MGEKVYGYHAIEEALKKASHGSTLYLVRGERERSEELDRKARLTGKVAVKKISKQEMDRMVPGIDHRGALLDLGGPRKGASRLTEISVSDFCAKLKEDEGALVLILDGLTDPHNLGAIIRTANLCGAHGVIIPKRRAVGLTPTVAKTSAGAINYTPVAKVTNISNTIKELKERGMWFVCADMGGTTMYDLNLTGSIGLVIGNEGEGVSKLVKENCDMIASIPMKGNIDSLNASVATGVLAYEIVRQRIGKGK